MKTGPPSILSLLKSFIKQDKNNTYLAMTHDESVHRSMKRNKFNSHVQMSFFITLVNNGMPLVAFALVVLTCIYTGSLYKTGYMVACVAGCISIAYTLWYGVTYLFVYVIFYIQKIILSLFGRKKIAVKKE